MKSLEDNASLWPCCFSLLIVAFVVFFLFYCWVNLLAKQQEKEEKVKKLLDEMRDIYANVRKGEITKAEGDHFFDCVDEALPVIKSEPDSSNMKAMKREIEKMSRQVSFVLALQKSGTSMGDELDTLAMLRQQGIISEKEFQVLCRKAL